MAFTLRHRISDTALDHLIQLVDCHLPAATHKSKYMLLKNFETPKCHKIFFCYDCSVELSFEENTKINCTKCSKEYNKKNLIQKGQFFIHIPLKDQLIEIIQSKDFQFYQKNDNINDVSNGRVYQHLVKRGIIGKNDITLQWNTDGIALFNSSKKSTWSILTRIINLPLRISKDNIMLCGLWHNRKKPIMKMFLRRFAEELVDLSTNGIVCTPFGGKLPIQIKVHTILAAVDTPARCAIQNFKQFNAKWGCPYCVQEGETFKMEEENSENDKAETKSKNYLRNQRKNSRSKKANNKKARKKKKEKKKKKCGHKRIYPVSNDPDRDHVSYERDVKIAEATNKAIRGVKGPCIMSKVPNLDTLICYPPEYMHAWLLGVTKMMVEAWIDSKNHEEEWYIGTKIKEINSLLHEICPPCEITRCPENIEDIQKASQWKNFLLYYSMVVLKNILPKKFYDHWFLFVYSAHTLLKPTLSKEEFQSAEKCLIEFHDGIEKLYGKRFMSFNVHTLKHSMKFVKYFGSLWAWSAFPFENYNGVIKKLFHGTQCIPEQICKSYFRLRQIKSKSEIFDKDDCSQKGKNLFIKMMESCEVKNCIRYNDDLKLFSPKRCDLTELEGNLTKIHYHESVVNVLKIERFLLKRTLWHARSYRRLKKRNNSCFMTKSGQAFTLDKLIKFNLHGSEEEKVVALALKIDIYPNEYLCKVGKISTSSFLHIGKQTQDICIIDVSSLEMKCLCMPYGVGRVCVQPLVNKIETD